MADIFNFYVRDDRLIDFNAPEPIMQEDKDVAVWRFRIPKVLNQIDMTAWAWWFVYINAKGQKYSESLTLTDDADEPDTFSVAEYSVDYGISKNPGNFTFALEAINADQGGEIVGEWHTYTYTHKVIGTLQGNQAEFVETESDIISALIVQIQQKYNSLVGGATPQVVSSISEMIDTSKIYVLSTDGDWYYYNGSTWTSGGQYASGVTIDPTLSQSGQAADAKVVGDVVYNYTAGEYVVKMPESVRIESFNYNTGYANANDKNRMEYRGGFSPRGAKLFDVEVASGYKWNAYFANTNGAYTFVSRYSTAWVEETKRLIPIPDAADRIYLQFAKIDGSIFTESEIQNVFQIMLRGAKEKEIVEYTESTNLHTDYYGHYQYINADPTVNQWSRLTQDRLYEIGDYDAVVLSPNTGYRVILNFFDANLNRLGNSGSWTTSKSLILFKSFFSNAKYFKITYSKTDNSNMGESDYNQFTVDFFKLKQIAPIIGEKQLKFVESFDDHSGDVAVYNGHIVVADMGKIWLDGTEISASVGHGNNIQFGTTLDGDFPRLYAGSWYNTENRVYVSKITASSTTLLNIIEYSTLPTGYLNMCVDEENERVYIFMETGEDTHAGNILFAVGDFEGNIISQKALGVSIPIIQGMEYKDSFIYVTSGNGTAQYPNCIRCFDTSGNVLSVNYVSNFTEIEGLSIDIDGTTYIKFLRSLFEV